MKQIINHFLKEENMFDRYVLASGITAVFLGAILVFDNIFSPYKDLEFNDNRRDIEVGEYRLLSLDEGTSIDLVFKGDTPLCYRIGMRNLAAEYFPIPDSTLEFSNEQISSLEQTIIKTSPPSDFSN